MCVISASYGFLRVISVFRVLLDCQWSVIGVLLVQFYHRPITVFASCSYSIRELLECYLSVTSTECFSLVFKTCLSVI
jgi:hypothetical protein